MKCQYIPQIILPLFSRLQVDIVGTLHSAFWALGVWAAESKEGSFYICARSALINGMKGEGGIRRRGGWREAPLRLGRNLVHFTVCSRSLIHYAASQRKMAPTFNVNFI